MRLGKLRRRGRRRGEWWGDAVREDHGISGLRRFTAHKWTRAARQPPIFILFRKEAQGAESSFVNECDLPSFAQRRQPSMSSHYVPIIIGVYNTKRSLPDEQYSGPDETGRRDIYHVDN